MVYSSRKQHCRCLMFPAKISSALLLDGGWGEVVVSVKWARFIRLHWNKGMDPYSPSSSARSSASPGAVLRPGIPRLSLSRLTDEDIWGVSPPYSRAQSVGPRSLSSHGGPKGYDPSSLSLGQNKYRRSLTSGVHRRLDGGPSSVEDSVVIRAGFSILPSQITRTTFKARYEPKPAHQDPQTASARLTAQIKDFLKRSDHIEQQWSALHPGKRSRDSMSASIAIRGYQIRHSTSWTTIDEDSSYGLNNSQMSLNDVGNVFDEREPVSEASQSNILPLLEEPLSQASVASESPLGKIARKVAFFLPLGLIIAVIPNFPTH